MKKSINSRFNRDYTSFRNQSINQSINQLIKKTSLILIALVMFIAVNAQIKVFSDGKVSIRSSTMPTNVGIYLNSSTEINGTVYFSNGYGKFLNISGNYDHPQITPYLTNRGFLGTSTKQFSQIHAQTYYCNGTSFQSSDLKLKENIKEIEKPLHTIMQLRGKKYDYKIDSTDLKGNKEEVEKNIALKKNKYGFIAQEVQKVLPEVTHFNNENEILYLDYTAFIPILVEALKEQQTLIVDLKTELEQLKNAIPTTKSAGINGIEANTESLNTATLAQNIPNPFSNTTRIDIYLPETVKNAVLYVYNMQGVQIKSFNINERGATSVTIEGYTLQAGMLCHCKKVSYYGTMQMA